MKTLAALMCAVAVLMIAGCDCCHTQPTPPCCCPHAVAGHG